MIFNTWGGSVVSELEKIACMANLPCEEFTHILFSRRRNMPKSGTFQTALDWTVPANGAHIITLFQLESTISWNDPAASDPAVGTVNWNGTGPFTPFTTTANINSVLRARITANNRPLTPDCAAYSFFNIPTFWSFDANTVVRVELEGSGVDVPPLPGSGVDVNLRAWGFSGPQRAHSALYRYQTVIRDQLY